MAEELKACAHCGGKAKMFHSISFVWIECSSCGMNTGKISKVSGDEAAMLIWNARAGVVLDRDMATVCVLALREKNYPTYKIVADEITAQLEGGGK